MANIKISQLPASTTISPGTDVVPIVHSGTTEKATPNQIVNKVLESPGSIGSVIPGSGTFGALVSTSTTILNGTLVPAGKDLITTNDTQTLTGKTLNLANNTLVGTLAEFNTACSDGNFLSDSDVATLTNKTINLANNTVTGTFAQFNAACTDSTFVNLSSTQTLDNKTINATGHVKSASPSDGVGYSAGAGGSVSQATSRILPVTINKICGQVIVVSATTTAGQITAFTVNNSTVAQYDTVIVNVAGLTVTGQYIVDAVKVGTGSFDIQIYTPNAVTSSEYFTINFSVIKSVIS